MDITLTCAQARRVASLVGRRRGSIVLHSSFGSPDVVFVPLREGEKDTSIRPDGKVGYTPNPGNSGGWD